ncbi:Peroxisomal N(1)-acetyl-spermine/spermidine oxidase [Frankliniella fusca]|uniref:Peroxisomal N(1)-acetyl-spermine/spermidine oxidase n=1 Tax=Frankliniella fusca TaxID=407009 RepID=A0AAE1HE95_9NEOP|nr:Peroxisomal N(1)-acetyl-spermine/spermidine oxidase [Frankliniella fusca]
MASSELSEDRKRVKILIIGAGMAGLSAANHLAKNGMTDFLVLEASNKIGGRIFSAQTGKHRLELGANWIHGVLGNPLYEIAIANGLIDIVHVPKPHRIVAATEDGKQVPFGVLQEMYQAYVCFLRRCEEYFLCQYLPPEGINSVGEHLGLEMTLFLEKVSDPAQRHLRSLIFRCLLKRETCIAGCHSMSDIDLMQLGSYTELQGGNIALPSGYSSILEPVSRLIPPENILKKHPVANIKWRYCEEILLGNSVVSPGTDSGIDLQGLGDPGNESDDSDVTVTGETPAETSPNSSRESSSEKECTSVVENIKPDVSINVSAEGGSKGNISESCMESKTDEHCLGTQDGSKTVSYSNSRRKKNRKRRSQQPNVEVVCENGQQFYADHVICCVPLGVLKAQASQMFSPPLPQFKLKSIDKLLYDTVDKIFLEYDRPFLNPEVSEVMLLWDSEECCSEATEMKNKWYRKIYSFSKISETLLLAWISGKEAEYMETLSHEEVAETCTDILRKFLNDPFVPKPRSCICTTWGSQPYTRGSYTAIAVGASQDDIDNVAQPLYSNDQQVKPVVLFAGEHTHSSFYSTVHGAYLTGRSAAQILLAPDSPEELILEADEDASDLSSWIQGIALQ